MNVTQNNRLKQVTFDTLIVGVDVGVIIPGFFEPLVRTLRATVPKNESHIFR